MAHTGIVQWAGQVDPGDAWMSELLRCYWRHATPRHYMEKMGKRMGRKSVANGMATMAVLKDKDATLSDDDDFQLSQLAQMNLDHEAQHRADLMATRMQNETALETVEVHELLRWMKLVHTDTHSYQHTAYSVEVVLDAVQRMGGWKYYEVFCVMWLK